MSLGDRTSDETLAVQQEQMMQESNRQTGMPAIKNFQERKLAKLIFELRDKENLICYAYLKSEYSGKLIFIGKCIGYGLPYSIQYTNPEKYYEDPNGNYDAGFQLYCLKQILMVYLCQLV